MYCWKIMVLALAAFTIAMPPISSQHLAGSDQMKAYPLIEGTNTPMHSRLDPRDFKEEDKFEKLRTEWREIYWPIKERRHWESPVLNDFQKIIMPHLPPGILCPSSLLPTNNVTLMNDVYIPAAVLTKIEELKTPRQRKLELEVLKKSAENFMIASRCLHLKDCKAYKGFMAVNLDLWSDNRDMTAATKGSLRFMEADEIKESQNRAMNRGTFKAKVYNPLAAEVEKQTTKEGLVNLGRRLKALGFPTDEH